MITSGLKNISLLLCLAMPFLLHAQEVKILTNHVGYGDISEKKAVVMSETQLPAQVFQLVDANTGKTVFTGRTAPGVAVDHWKHWQFSTADFSKFKLAGTYRLELQQPAAKVISYPFMIGKNVLEAATLSDVVYYFKGQRSSGLLDQVDHHLALAGSTKDTIDAHGGWYDATGDYGKHLSHLSFSAYFNPQQIALTDWSLFKTYALLSARPGNDFRQIDRRILDEAMYGADYLVRMQVKDGSFYRSVASPGPGKLPGDRVIQAEEGSYRIKQSSEQAFSKKMNSKSLLSYQVSYRSGGGMAIAALAMAAGYTTSGQLSNAAYLQAAERAFAFLEAHNNTLDYDGKENILDDYCALSATTELYRVTKNMRYQQAAERRAAQLMARLTTKGQYKDYWRADQNDRPFFHPSDAGLPVVSLLTYYPLALPPTKEKIRAAVKRSLTFELTLTHEVNNPFGYSRQLVQDTLGNRHSSFFFPHGSDASPWWQGENARLASMAAAAKMAAAVFTDDQAFQARLTGFAQDQLNWILGLNPYDASMLQGTGHNNPSYGFFGTFEYTNAPGGIVNGITGGLDDEHNIEFNLPYSATGKDYDWRWAEQWLPHTAWYLLAIALN